MSTQELNRLLEQRKEELVQLQTGVHKVLRELRDKFTGKGCTVQLHAEPNSISIHVESPKGVLTMYVKVVHWDILYTVRKDNIVVMDGKAITTEELQEVLGLLVYVM